MRVALVIAISACSAPAKPPAPAPAAPPPPRDLAVAEPPPKQPVPPPEQAPRDPFVFMRGGRPEIVIRRGPVAPPQDLSVADNEMWSPCVRELWQAQPEPARRALTAVFRRYTVGCDADGRVTIAAPIEYRSGSHVAYTGTLTRARYDLAVDVVACGPPATIDRVVLGYDGQRWASGRALADRRGNCNVASVPNGRTIRRALRDAVDARDAVVHFEGRDAPDDLPITDDMKRDLRLMLDALDALTE